MKKLLIMLFVVMSCSQAFAVTGDVTIEGLLQITQINPKFLLTDTQTPYLSLGLVSEVGGQLIDYGSNYNQMGRVDASYPGGFFRIDLRTDYTSEFFNVKYVPPGGVTTSEITLYKVSTAGDMVTKGNITAPIFYGTFEGTYTGLTQTGVAFLYPYGTAEAHILLPHNASITSVEVYVLNGTSAVGRVDIGSSNASNTAGTGWMLATGTALPWTYSAYTDIKFTTPTVTGAVNSTTIQILYKRTP